MRQVMLMLQLTEQFQMPTTTRSTDYANDPIRTHITPLPNLKLE